MSEKPGVSSSDLASIPLLRGFTDEQLQRLIELMEPSSTPGTLFEEGSPAEAFYVLNGGEVSLYQGDEETHCLHPTVLIGELGALTGRTRNSRAEAKDGARVWQIEVQKLLALFDEDKDIGLGFQQNLIHIVADKIQRDQVRLQDMRANLIRTQKQMKQMRDFLLESQETVVSSRLHETLDALIRRNRRVNYRVEPPPMLAAQLRLDGGKGLSLIEATRTHLVIPDEGQLKSGDRMIGVLHLGGPEIPVSGVVATVGDGRVDVTLDLLIEEYAAELEGYLTRAQMLDFLV